MENLTTTPHLGTSNLGAYNPTVICTNMSSSTSHSLIRKPQKCRMAKVPVIHSLNKILLNSCQFAKQHAKCLGHKSEQKVVVSALMGLTVEPKSPYSHIRKV